MIDILEKLVLSHDHICIVGHFNPDGDAVGSSLGIHYFLQNLGKKSTPILPTPPPDYLNFLDEEKEIIIFSKNEDSAKAIIDQAELIICVDFNKLSRIEDMAEPIQNSKAKKILIDHHPNPDTEAFDLIISDTSASSTCELVFWTLLKTKAIAEDASNFQPRILRALSTGLLTDTNSFRNSTTASTHNMARLLLEQGISLEEIQNRVNENFSENRMRLMGELLYKQMIIKDDAAIFILSREMQDRYGYKTGDSEGIVNLPLMIKKINISAMFIETNEYIKVSLRSKNDFSVNRLSMKYFNGGGHERAAGGRLNMKIEEIENYFFSSVEEFKREN